MKKYNPIVKGVIFVCNNRQKSFIINYITKGESIEYLYFYFYI